TLTRPDLTFAEPVTPCVPIEEDCSDNIRIAGVSDLLQQDPRAALPWITLFSIPAAPNGEPAFSASDLDDPTDLAKAIANAGGDETESATWLRGQLPPEYLEALAEWAALQPPPSIQSPLKDGLMQLLYVLVQSWEARQDLLESGLDDRHFVVEIDDDRRAHLRFGDGANGRLPEAGASFYADYRIGNGTLGNVGADTVTCIVFRDRFPDGHDLHPTNPLSAVGAQAAEPVAEARLRAPHVFRNRLERAVTADDYANIVMRDFASRVQRAAAALCWNGIASQILVAIDALGQVEPDVDLLCEIEQHLRQYRRLGHDVHVAAARSVALDIELAICVRQGFLREHVKAALLDTFSSRMRSGGQLGFFHPDKMTFGQGIYVSGVVAVAQVVEGVESVRVVRFQRLFEEANGELETGILGLGPLEVGRLDNDPGFPEHGRLILTLEGGR
ncbi:MAG: putative baseplate assembly protein, partial [Geminicoccaceae bacterium]